MQHTPIFKLTKYFNVNSLLFISLLFNYNHVNGQLGRNSHMEYRNGAVVSAHPEATKVGVEILKKGGNAIDASIAVNFALAVVYPNAGNIGGGGFMVYRTSKGETTSLDFREKAPAAATKDMYLDADGNVVKDKSLYGQLAAGVPGAVAGMVEMHKKYGSLKWADLVEPARKLAADGFKITQMQATEMNNLREKFILFNPLGTALVKVEGDWKAGDLLVQTELANTMRLIKEKGSAGFYEGEVADFFVEEMKGGGGIITKEDLKNYHAVWRKPVVGSYKGYKVITMAPPSSGGIALLQLLQMVEPYAINQWQPNSPEAIHLMVEAERRVYADRAKHLGDPDFWTVPQQQLLDKSYNKSRMENFLWDKATPSSAVSAGNFALQESEQTTHFSIVDKEGNAVSLTTTINAPYGALVTVKGAGFLLNNEMDDFSVKPNSPNYFGLVGDEANAIAPHKRMLSSMTPTILEKDGDLFMVVGTPGGSTIITSVFQTILNVIDFGRTMQQAVSIKRFHHQWLPDQIFVEETTFDDDLQQKMEAKGHTVFKRMPIGRVEAILKMPNGSYQTGADPRGDDTAGGW